LAVYNFGDNFWISHTLNIQTNRLTLFYNRIRYPARVYEFWKYNIPAVRLSVFR